MSLNAVQRGSCVGLAVMLWFSGGEILAGQAGDLFFTKAFLPDTIGPGSVSTLRFDITNNDPLNPAEEMAFTDNLPAAVTVASPANVTNTCGGLVSAPNGGVSISFSDGSLGAGASCAITVDVTSNTVGTHSNVSGDLTSSFGNSGSAAADLTVATDRPGFTKSFTPGSVPLGTRSRLTFTIDNSANASLAFNLSFTDNLPAGMVIAEPADAFDDCAAGFFTGGELTAVPGTGVISLGPGDSFAAVDAGGTCTISVDVVTTGAGALGNTSGELTSQPLAGGTRSSGRASAILQVTVDAVSLVKEFTDDPAPPGGQAILEFRIANRDRLAEATGIQFTDDLGAALMGLTATDTPLIDPCGTGSMLSGTSVLALTGGVLAPGASCSFSVTLDVPATGGVHTNTTSPLAALLNGDAVAGSPASDDLFVVAAPVLTKAFTDDPVTAGDTVTLEFTITNTDPDSDATDIGFEDNLTATLTGLTGNGLPMNNVCGVGSILSQSVNGLEETILSLTGGSLAPAGLAGDSCTFSLTLDVPPDAPTGAFLNRTTEITATVADPATEGSMTVTGNSATDDLVVVAAPSLRKEFTDDPVPAGDLVTLEFTLIHSPEAPGDASGIHFTDDLSAVLPGLTATGLPMTGICGAGSSISGTTTLSMTGGTLSPGDSCTFAVTLQVPGAAAPGDHSNTTSEVEAFVESLAVRSAPAQDDLIVASLLFTKEFIDDPIIPGDTGTLRFTIDNVGSEDAVGVTFTDNLDDVLSGLAAVAPLPIEPCGTGSSITGAGFLIFTGGNLTGGDSCTFDVSVMVPAATADGTYNNATSELTATIAGNPVTIDPAADALAVDSTRVLLTKEFTDDPAAPGGAVTLLFTLTNLDADETVSNIAFTDNLDNALSGLSAIALPPSGSACNGAGTLSGASLLDFSGGSLAGGGSCSFSATLQVPAGLSPGAVIVNTTSQVTGTLRGLAVTGDPASDNLLVDSVSMAKSFGGPAMPGATVSLNFTLTNLSLTDSVAALSFTDDLNNTLPGLAATGLPLGDVCGVGSQISGASLLTFSGGSLDPGEMCSFNVTLLTPTDASPGGHPNTTSPVTSSGLEVGDAATASLTVEPPPPPLFSKNFSPSLIGLGGISLLTFTIDNTASTVPADNLDFSDSLPIGMQVASSPSPSSTTCSGGTLTAPVGLGLIGYSGGSVAAASSCEVQIAVTANLAGSLVNTSGNLTSTSGDSGTATATLTVVPPPGFTKEFSPGAIQLGGISTLIFTIDNRGSGADATNLQFFDTLPTNVVIATPSNAVTDCIGGVLTAPDGGSTISYGNGTVAAGMLCTVRVDVTSAVASTHVNVSSELTSDAGPSGPATAELIVNPLPVTDLRITKSPDEQTVNRGDRATFTITLSNVGETVVTELTVDDPTTPECSRAEGILPDLAPGESTGYTCETARLLTDLTNTATATGRPAEGEQVTASASATVLVFRPVTGIPTLSDVGALALLVLLAGAGFMLLRR